MTPSETVNTAPEVLELSAEKITPETPIEAEKLSLPTDTPKAIAPGGIYLPYTPTALAQAKGNIILFFYASWCPTCAVANTDILTNSSDIPSDLTIFRVNFDDETGLRKKYEVTQQHTFVQVNNDGDLIRKWRGASTLSEIVSEVEKE